MNLGTKRNNHLVHPVEKESVKISKQESTPRREKHYIAKRAERKNHPPTKKKKKKKKRERKVLK